MLGALGLCSLSFFAQGVIDAYKDAYGELKVPVSFREEIYENDWVSLLLHPTGSVGVLDIYVKYLEGFGC